MKLRCWKTKKHNYHNLQIWIISLLINDHIIVDHEETIIVLNLEQWTNFWNYLYIYNKEKKLKLKSL
jgi:hypothetical protein